MRLKQYRSGHSIDVSTPLLAPDASLDHRSFCCCRRHTLVNEVNRQARRAPQLAGKLLRASRLRAKSPVEPPRQSDHDALGFASARDVRKPRRKAGFWLGGHSGQGLRDRARRVAEGEADSLRPRIDGEDPQLIHGC